jgi:hypothetical protein
MSVPSQLSRPLHMSSADRPGGKRRRNGFLKSSGLGLEALNGTLLSIDRLGGGRGRDRPSTPANTSAMWPSSATSRRSPGWVVRGSWPDLARADLLYG